MSTLEEAKEKCANFIKLSNELANSSDEFNELDSILAWFSGIERSFINNKEIMLKDLPYLCELINTLNVGDFTSEKAENVFKIVLQAYQNALNIWQNSEEYPNLHAIYYNGCIICNNGAVINPFRHNIHTIHRILLARLSVAEKIADFLFKKDYVLLNIKQFLASYQARYSDRFNRMHIFQVSTFKEWEEICLKWLIEEGFDILNQGE